MAKGYQLIQAQTLASATSSITFSNIPQNFTDLKILLSIRSSQSGAIADYGTVSFNGSTSNFSYKDVYGNGSTSASTGGSTSLLMTYQGNAGTANVFGNSEIYIPNYGSANNKSFSIDGVVENNATTGYPTLTAGLWSNTAAITSITLSPASGTWQQFSTVYLYGIGGTRATGGTITADGNYTYHTFTSSSTFTALEKIKNAEFLVIAGGGGGSLPSASQAGGAGGGAGGLLRSVGQTLLAGTSYSAIVGAGGAGTTGTTRMRGTNGSDSLFSALQSFGGGGAGAYDGLESGLVGGSGGGSGGGFVTISGVAGTSGQGFAGGAISSGAPYTGSGGGGAGGAGGNAGGTTQAGAGGIGSASYSAWGLATNTGQNVSGTYYYAGGGGGSNGSDANFTYGLGGWGGGGRGADGLIGNTTGVAGTANTGGGGGGGVQNNGGAAGTTFQGKAGGSGLVIIRYPNT